MTPEQRYHKERTWSMFGDAGDYEVEYLPDQDKFQLSLYGKQVALFNEHQDAYYCGQSLTQRNEDQDKKTEEDLKLYR